MQDVLQQQNTSQKLKLSDQAGGILRAKHYSTKTEQSYIHWMLRLIRFHNTRHPKDMGEKEISRFLTHLAVKENVAASTQNQCLCALIFLYSHVIKKDVGELSIYWAQKPKRLPTVFLAPAIRDEKLKLARQSLQDKCGKMNFEMIKVHDADFAINSAGRCPKCRIARMRVVTIGRETMQRNWMLYMNSS